MKHFRRRTFFIANILLLSALTIQLLFADKPSTHSLKSIQKDSLMFTETWRFGIFGRGIGANGLLVADIDDDGTPETICSGNSAYWGSDFWYVVEYDDSLQSYVQQWISNYNEESIADITIDNVDNNDTCTIYVGMSGGDVYIFDGGSMTEIGYISSPAAEINRILIADSDNDSVPEINFCDDNNLYIYSIDSFNLEAQIPYGANDFEVGNVDSDALNEIVMANGYVLELNGDSVAVEWVYPGGSFGYLVELSDIDNDNMKEIIGASSWYYITAFDADVQSPKWQINADLDIDALLVVDVDNDGVDDVLYGDGQWGEIHCYDAVTLTEKWYIPNPEHGLTDIAVFDTDSDGDLEILWGGGNNYLFVYSIPTLTEEWRSFSFCGPFYALDVNDVDSDGNEELICVSYGLSGGSDYGLIFIFDAATHDLEWRSDTNFFPGWPTDGIHDVKIGDIDDDGTQEIVIATDNLYNGALYVVDGISHLVTDTFYYDDGSPIISCDIADIDNDNETEIIAGGSAVHSGAPGVYVYVIDGSSGIVEWHSIHLGNSWSEIYTLETGDVDNDSVLEIAAVNDWLFIIDGISHIQWQSTESNYYGMALGDFDNDGVPEIFVGTSDGRIVAVDGSNYNQELDITVSDSAIYGLYVYDIDQNGSPEVIFCSEGRISVLSLEDSSLLWQSDRIGIMVGGYNSIAVADYDSDDRTEILVGVNHIVVEFEGPEISCNQEIVSKPIDVIRLSVSPNPFARSITIRYSITDYQYVSDNALLKIYDVTGKLVKQFDNTVISMADQITWNGDDDHGCHLPAGVYFCRLGGSDFCYTEKIVKLK